MNEHYISKLNYLKEQFEIGNYGRAERSANELIESEIPDFVKEGLLYLGLCFSMQNGEEEALKYYTEAIHQFPEYELPYLARFECLIKLRAFEEARKDALKLYAFDPKNTEYLSALITVSEYFKDFETVAEKCTEILNDYPDSINFLFTRASAYLELEAYEAAAVDYNEANQYLEVSDIERAMIFNDIGSAFSRRSRFDEAKNFLKKALTYDEHPFISGNLGYVLAELGDKKGGLDLINKSIKMNPRSSFAYKNRAKIFLMDDLKEEAIADLEIAQQLNYEQNYGSEVNDLLKQLSE